MQNDVEINQIMNSTNQFKILTFDSWSVYKYSVASRVFFTIVGVEEL